MNWTKKALNITASVLILLIIIAWAYFLYQDFKELPASSENMKFAVFNIKILLFSLFLITSLTTAFYLNSPDKKEIKHAPGDGHDHSQLMQKINEATALIKNMPRPQEDKKAPEKEAPVQAPDAKDLEKLQKYSSVRSKDDLFTPFMETASELTKAERISVYLYDFQNKKLTMMKNMGFKTNNTFDEKDEDLERSIAWQTFQNGKRIFATNIETHPGISRKNKSQYIKKSLMIFPVRILEDETIGVVNMTEKNTEDGVFTKKDLEIMGVLLGLFESKLENQILLDSLEGFISKKESA